MQNKPGSNTGYGLAYGPELDYAYSNKFRVWIHSRHHAFPYG